MADKITEKKLASLAEAKAQGKPQAAAAVEKLLGDRSNIVVAKAAQTAGELGLTELVPHLLRALDAIMQGGGAADKWCRAKLAIVTTLRQLNACEAKPLLRGVRHVQMEPGFGPPTDSAGPLRVECAAGLAEIGYHGTLVEVATLLGDRVLDARVGAARILGQMKLPAAEALLRLRVLAGEKEPAAMQEYFAAILAVNTTDGPAFVARYLSAADEGDFEAAATALGESRCDGAMAALAAAAADDRDPQRRKVLLSSIALLRRNDAMDFLLAMIADAPEPAATDAIEALAVYRQDEALAQRVRSAARMRSSPRLRQALATFFTPR